MSGGKILFASENIWNKKKCNECQVAIEEKQPGFLHMQNSYPCSFVECLWCCFKKACEYQKYPEKCFFKCCPKNNIGIWKQLIDMLRSNCIICGKYCSSQKIQIGEENVKFLVGKDCYKRLLSNENNILFKGLSALEKKICEGIKKYSKYACAMNPNKHQGDRILACEKQLLLLFCSKCYEQSQADEQKWKKFSKNCCQCKQTQIYEQLGTYRMYMKKTPFTLIQIHKNWDKQNQKFLYCSFCLYLNYLTLEKEQISLNKKPQYQFTRLKAKYQRHFMDHCMVCAKKQQQSVDVFTIISPNTKMGIYSYICIHCHNIKNTQKYNCLKDFGKFLKQTKQNDLGKPNAMKMNNFKSIAQSLLDQLLNKKNQYKERKHDKFWPTNSNHQNQTFNSQKKYNKWEQGQYEEETNNFSRKTQLITDPDIEPNSYRNDRNQQKISVIVPQTNAMEQIFEVKLEKFQFRPVKTQKQVFDREKWQKSLIQEFDKISQKEKNLQLKDSKPFKISEEEKWRPRSIISEPENFIKQQQCLMYKKCRMTQKYLNIERLCKICFVKYLIGDRQIIDAVQKSKKPQMKEARQQMRPNTSQEGKKNQKEKSMIYGFFDWS